jgi:hypothetical protein
MEQTQTKDIVSRIRGLYPLIFGSRLDAYRGLKESIAKDIASASPEIQKKYNLATKYGDSYINAV